MNLSVLSEVINVTLLVTNCTVNGEKNVVKFFRTPSSFYPLDQNLYMREVYSSFLEGENSLKKLKNHKNRCYIFKITSKYVE